MLRQAENRVKIEGILAETDIKYGSYTKDGKTIENIGGMIKVLVNQEINGVPTSLEIPVHMFSNKYTKSGELSPAYSSIEKVMKEFVSIAAAGGEAGATRIRITSGNIRMNEYYAPDGKLVSYPRINANFISAVSGEFKPEATFSLEFCLSSITMATDSEGVEIEPQTAKIAAILPQYGGVVDCIEMVTSNPNVINAISQYWERGGSYKAHGRLNFTSTTVVEIEKSGFGDPVEKVKTTTISELVLTGGSDVALDGDYAFDTKEVAAAVAARKAKLEELKNKPKTRVVPAPATTAGKMDDLGF